MSGWGPATQCEAVDGSGTRCVLPAGHVGDHAAQPAAKPRSAGRPNWALPVFVVGLLAAAAALFFDALFVIRQNSAGASRYDSFVLLYNTALVPLAAILLAIGGLALIRPAMERRPWLRVVVLGAVLLWAVAACFGPGLLGGRGVEPAL
jgi:hypothetical protein